MTAASLTHFSTDNSPSLDFLSYAVLGPRDLSFHRRVPFFHHRGHQRIHLNVIPAAS